jgi:hypothetical protein
MTPVLNGWTIPLRKKSRRNFFFLGGEGVPLSLWLRTIENLCISFVQMQYVISYYQMLNVKYTASGIYFVKISEQKFPITAKKLQKSFDITFI